MTETLPNLVKEKSTRPGSLESQIRQTQRGSHQDIIIKMAEVEDKDNLKSSKRKAVTYKELPYDYELISQ